MAPTRAQDAHGTPVLYPSSAIYKNNGAQAGSRVEKTYKQKSALSAGAFSWANGWAPKFQLPFLQAGNGHMSTAVPHYVSSLSSNLKLLLTPTVIQIPGLTYDVQPAPALEPAPVPMPRSVTQLPPMTQPAADLACALIDQYGRPLASMPSVARVNHQLPQYDLSQENHPMPLMERPSSNIPASGERLTSDVKKTPSNFPACQEHPNQIQQGNPFKVHDLTHVEELVTNSSVHKEQPAPVSGGSERLLTNATVHRTQPVPVSVSERVPINARVSSKLPAVEQLLADAPNDKEKPKPAVEPVQVLAPADRELPAVQRSLADAPVRRSRRLERLERLRVERLEDNAPDPRGASATERLPFHYEHSVLCSIQNLAEAALFEFANKYAPEMLQKKGWQTFEQGELNHWRGLLLRMPNDLENSVNRRGFSMNNIRKDILTLHVIRHSAVHRLTTPISRLQQMLIDAQVLMRDLNDSPRVNKLYSVSLALTHRDTKALGDILKAPVETFNRGHNFENFRSKELQSVDRQQGTGSGQRVSNSEAVMIDLTDEDNPSTKIVIDLTDD